MMLDTLDFKQWECLAYHTSVTLIGVSKVIADNPLHSDLLLSLWYLYILSSYMFDRRSYMTALYEFEHLPFAFRKLPHYGGFSKYLIDEHNNKHTVMA